MADITLKVTPDVLRDTAGQVRTTVGQLRNGLDDAKSLVERSRFYWMGQAGDKYRRSFVARRTEAQELLDRLGKYPSDLLQMAQIYDQAESTNVQDAGKLSTDIIE